MPVTANPLHGEAGVFIGEDAHSEGVVMRRINVRCYFKLPDRAFDKNTPIEEIPMLRMLYSYYGGRVIVLGGPQHAVFRQYVVQDLSHTQLEHVVERYRRAYNGTIVRQARVDIFDAVYGKDSDCQFLERMRDIVELFDTSLDSDEVPEHVDTILAHLFPHASQSVLSRGAQALAGIDTLGEPPKPGKRAKEGPVGLEPPRTPTLDVEVNDETAREGRDTEPMVDTPPTPEPEQSEPKEADSESVNMLGDEAPERDLIVHLVENGYEDAQAYALAEMLLRKPTKDWTSEDYQEHVPGLNKKNHPRVTRIIHEYLEHQEMLSMEDDEGGIPLN